MAVKAVGVLRTIEFNDSTGNVKVFMDVHAGPTNVHYNIEAGSYSAAGNPAVINAQIAAAIKDYAKDNMGVTFGLLDRAALFSGVDLV